jgi:hypothetical protein
MHVHARRAWRGARTDFAMPATLRAPCWTLPCPATNIPRPHTDETAMTPRNPSTQAALDKLLQEHGLTGDTRLYGDVARDALVATNLPDVFTLVANPEADVTVVDVYGHGHVMQAPQVGAGLAFARSATPNWQETTEMRALRSVPASAPAPRLDSVEVEVRLGEILTQGGLIYPVESVTVEQAWYCTLPEGSVQVMEAR